MASSLRRQLLAWLLFPLGALVLLNAWLGYRGARATAVSMQDQLLLGSARIIGEHVTVDEAGARSAIPPAALELFQSNAADHVYFRVAAPDGTPLSGYADLPPPPAGKPEQSSAFFSTVYRGQPLRVAAYAQPVFSSHNGFITVEVAQTLHGQDALTYRLFFAALRQQFVLLLCVTVLLWVGLERALAPLLRLRTRMLARRPGALEPLDTAGIPIELMPVAEALNDYVRRLDEYVSAHSRFVANASHQLRTPLTVLNTQVSAALRSAEPAERDEALRAIHGSVRHGIRLVNQLLNLSAAEAGAKSAATAETDLAATVQHVLEDLALAAQAKDIDLGFELEGEPAPVRAAPGMLRELVANLVDNAVRYTAAGGKVTAGVRAAAGAVLLRVEDNGPGIPATQRERIFERFYRLDDRRSDGSGLGLAIVREIANACDATVALADPDSGSGLVVSVAFPLVTQSPLPPERGRGEGSRLGDD